MSFGLFVPAGFLLAAGLLTISSASSALFALQALWAFFGVSLMIVLSRVDVRALLHRRWVAWGFYGVAIVLLIATLFFGPVVRGTRSWIAVGPITFQPVELAKIALIIGYAQYFSRRHLSVARWRNITGSFFFFILPAALTMVQPDLGSAIILGSIWFGFLLVSGLPRGRVVAAVALFLFLGAFGWSTVLKDYQRERIIGVFYPERNALTYNYNVIQSKIAIGSAGWFGKGYGQGSQVQLGFLPEPASDFVFAAFVEEWGMAGGLAVIGAFLALIVSMLRVGLHADRNVEKFVVLGTTVVFGSHMLLNIGSALGIVPVVGVPFPFMSHGGSNLLTSCFLLGIINAIEKAS